MDKFRIGIASLFAVVLVCVSCNKEAVAPDAPVAPAFVPTEPVPEAVDLGLPSGTLWASFNLGASSREEKGKSYAWGETQPKKEYTVENYRFWLQGTTPDNVVFSKYVSQSGKGMIDGRSMLGQEDDAAFVNLGSHWRVPTQQQFEELFTNCSIKAETVDGIDGILLTSGVDGFKSKTVFLPFTGYCSSAGWLDEDYYYLWTSKLNVNHCAYAGCQLGQASSYYFINLLRWAAMPIRPVYRIPLMGLSMDIPSATMEAGQTLQLTPVKTPLDASCRSFTWTSSEETIARVDEKGQVTAMGAGTAVITASAVGHTMSATCEITVSSTEPMPEMVDLGLPSGALWASFNLGASDIKSVGKYYAWGETAEKDSYAQWQDYLFRTAGNSDANVQFSKYVFGSGHGTADDKKVLELVDDAAHIHLAEAWHIPTESETAELSNYCSWNIVTIDGVKGFLLTSRVAGFHEKSLFFPATGYFTSMKENPGECYFWISQLATDYTYHARCRRFNQSTFGPAALPRYFGLPVRPVYRVELKECWFSSPGDIKAGSIVQLELNKYPANASCRAFTWTSDNESVARVDAATGVLTAVAPGQAKITIKAGDGSGYTDPGRVITVVE